MSKFGAPKKKRKKRKYKRPYEYRPSVTGVFLRPMVKKAPTEKSGIRIRPVVRRKKKIRWKFWIGYQ